MKLLKLFKRAKKEELKPMKTIKIGNNLPFNEMAEKQNITIYNIVR